MCKEFIAWLAVMLGLGRGDVVVLPAGYLRAVVQWARERGAVVASDLAGYRAGFVTGDPALVADLLAIRKQAGMIVPEPVQAAMTAALDDDAHAREQRQRYAARRSLLREALTGAGWTIDHSQAGLYLWATHPAHDCWSAADLLAAQCGIVVAPGAFYGPAGTRHIRVALTATDERVAAAAARLRDLPRA